MNLTILEWDRDLVITELRNGLDTALKKIIPVNYQLKDPKVLGSCLNLEFGILVGITGDIKSRFVMTGIPETYSLIAESMYGMPLEGDMLISFSGELGNMLAGTLSTNIEKKGIITAITAPTIMQGNTMLSGYENALNIPVDFQNLGRIDIYLLMD